MAQKENHSDTKIVESALILDSGDTKCSGHSVAVNLSRLRSTFLYLSTESLLLQAFEQTFLRNERKPCVELKLVN